MISDGMSIWELSSKDIFIYWYSIADDEKCRMYSFILKNIKHFTCMFSMWTIIESNTYFISRRNISSRSSHKKYWPKWYIWKYKRDEHIRNEERRENSLWDDTTSENSSFLVENAYLSWCYCPLRFLKFNSVVSFFFFYCYFLIFLSVSYLCMIDLLFFRNMSCPFA